MPAAKRGASMSDKQLAHTVKEGRRIRCWLSTGRYVEGYLGGWDDYHWLVVSPTSSSLLHKGNVAEVELLIEGTLEDEPDREYILSIIGPFQKFIEREVFSKHRGHTCSECGKEHVE